MRTKEEILEGRYTIGNNVVFEDSVPKKLANVIVNLNDRRKTRVRIYYGDVDTGKVWNEEFGTTGYIGYSLGAYDLRYPILIHNKNSYGGVNIFTNRILKIVTTVTKRVLYQVDNFQQPDVEIKGTDVYIDGELFGRCKTVGSAKRLASKMR